MTRALSSNKYHSFKLNESLMHVNCQVRLDAFQKKVWLGE
jgi:hypothetical protein